MATIDVKDAAGATVAIERPLAPARAAAAASRPVALSTEDKAALDALATQATAAAILAKIIAAPATEAKQDTGNASLVSIGSLLATQAGYLDGIETLLGALGTQTTLAAILAKIIAAPSTEAKQDTEITHLATLAGAVAAAIVKAKLTDGTRTAVIKAASTAPAAADEALVVSISPNSQNANGQVAMAASSPVAIASDQSLMPAALDTSKMTGGAANTTYTPKFVKIAAASSGNNTLLAAVSAKKIRVLAYNFMGAAAVNAKFQDGAGGTDLTGLKYLDAAGAGIVAPFNPLGWFETTANTLLNLNLSGAVAVGGELVYIEI